MSKTVSPWSATMIGVHDHPSETFVRLVTLQYAQLSKLIDVYVFAI